jgi:protein TonB
MFASVCETPRRRFGPGAIVSVAAHAALLAIALLFSPKPKTDDRPKPELQFVPVALKPRPAAPAGAGAPEPRKRTASASRRPPEPAIHKPRATEAPAEERSTAPVPGPGLSPGNGGAGNGDPSGGHGTGGPEGLSSAPAATSYEAIPFGQGMEAPRLVAATDVQYSAKAWAMKIGGVALARCTIELDGSLTGCRITHGLPYMDDAILEALRSWRYTPVLYQGHPQRVVMTVRIRVATPR